MSDKPAPMAFDASRQSDPDREPDREYPDEPIDYVDWAMRIAVFGPLLILHMYWIWTIFQNMFNDLMGR